MIALIALGFKEQAANLSPGTGSVGYISHVHRAFDYSGDRSLVVLWVHMA